MDYKGCGRGVGMSLIEWLIFTGRFAFEIRWAFFHMGLNRDIILYIHTTRSPESS